jgi:hypothetical protein
MLQGHHLGHRFLPRIMITVKYLDYTPIFMRTPSLHKLTARMCNMHRVEDKNS